VSTLKISQAVRTASFLSMPSNKRRNQRSKGGRKPRPSRENNRLPDSITEIRRTPTVKTAGINIMRTVNYTIQYSGNLGWNATGFSDLAFSFSLNSVDIFAGGVLLTSIAFGGLADMSNLFEWWRLKKVEMQIFTSSNNLPQTVAGTVAALPVSNIIFDPNDVAITSLNSALQYASLRTVQIGNGRYADGFTFSAQPTPLLLASSPVADGLMEPQRSTPYFSTETGAVRHFGVKIINDPGLAAVATNSVSYTFYVRCHYHMKETR
jgi:hypothetical protein